MAEVCIECEVLKWQALKTFRGRFNEDLKKGFSLQQPLREGFNRWLYDYFSSVVSEPVLSSSRLTGLDAKPDRKENTNVGCHLVPEEYSLLLERIINGGFTAHLFWELVDHLPTPLRLPRVKASSSIEPFITDMSCGGMPFDQSETYSGGPSSSQCSDAPLPLKTEVEVPHLSFSRCCCIFCSHPALHQLALNCAQSLQDLFVYHALSHRSVSPASSSDLSYVIYNWLYGKSPEDDAALHFSFVWAEHVLENCRFWDAGICLRTASEEWLTPLYLNGYLTHDTISSTPNDTSLPQLRLHAITPPAVLYALRHLRRRAVVARYSATILRFCYHNEEQMFELLRNGSPNSIAACQHAKKKKPIEDTLCLFPVYPFSSTTSLDSSMTSIGDLLTLIATPPHSEDPGSIRVFWDLTPTLLNGFLHICLNFAALRALWKRYRLSDPKSEELSGFRIFFLCVIRVVLRYDSLTGGGTAGRGSQAAVPRCFWETLISAFDISLECFASPFNTFCNSYLSLFPDCDRVFGSKGSFFDSKLQLLSGSYQLNPPFVEAVLERVIRRLTDWLESSETTSAVTTAITSPSSPGPLNFVLFVPNWNNGPGCRFLNALFTGPLSRFVRVKISAPSLHHAYEAYNAYDSVQLLKHPAMLGLVQTAESQWFNFRSNTRQAPVSPQVNNNLHHISAFSAVAPSLLFILQNQKGSERWPVTAALSDLLVKTWTVGTPRASSNAPSVFD